MLMICTQFIVSVIEFLSLPLHATDTGSALS